jgi:transposase
MNVSEAEWCQPDFVQTVTWIPSHRRCGRDPSPVQYVVEIEWIRGHFDENNLCTLSSGVHNDNDIMPPPGRRRPAEDAKAAALRAAGALHPRPERVQDEAFAQQEFFDRRDHVQVKYEMLRRHRVDGRPVTAVAAAFGTSRQTFYVTNAAFTTGGLPGLLPRPRGPQRAHKCTDAILDFVEQWRAEHEMAAGPGVTDAVRRRFHVTIHPRSLTRALARREKKRRPPGPPRP